MTLAELESCGWDAETIMETMLNDLPKTERTFLRYAKLGNEWKASGGKWWAQFFRYSNYDRPCEYDVMLITRDGCLRPIGMIKYHRGRLLTCYVVRGEK